MLTFLRKIRKSLIGSGSIRKYLLYAIGEIALVVIGILIALQINTWNEQKKLTSKEYHALSEIQSDLEVNIASLDNILYQDQNNIAKAINSINIVLDQLESFEIYNDSLADHFRNIYNYPDVDLKSSGYESLTSMGMDLVADNKIRSEIGKYYSFIIPRISIAHRELRDDFYKYMLEHMQEEFTIIRDGNRIHKLEPSRFDMLKQNPKYRQSLIMYLDLYNNYELTALTTLKEGKKLQERIRKTLEKD